MVYGYFLDRVLRTHTTVLDKQRHITPETIHVVENMISRYFKVFNNNNNSNIDLKNTNEIPLV